MQYSDTNVRIEELLLFLNSVECQFYVVVEMRVIYLCRPTFEI